MSDVPEELRKTFPIPHGNHHFGGVTSLGQKRMAVYYIGRDMFDNMISCPRLYADVRHTLQLDLAGLTDSGQYALFSFIHACIHSFVRSFTPSLEVRLYVSLSMIFKRKTARVSGPCSFTKVHNKRNAPSDKEQHAKLPKKIKIQSVFGLFRL